MPGNGDRRKGRKEGEGKGESEYGNKWGGEGEGGREGGGLTVTPSSAIVCMFIHKCSLTHSHIHPCVHTHAYTQTCVVQLTDSMGTAAICTGADMGITAGGGAIPATKPGGGTMGGAPGGIIPEGTGSTGQCCCPVVSPGLSGAHDCHGYPLFTALQCTYPEAGREHQGASEAFEEGCSEVVYLGLPLGASQEEPLPPLTGRGAVPLVAGKG